ncbi:hypothetical protein D3C81_1738530 [compost metagenome]
MGALPFLVQLAFYIGQGFMQLRIIHGLQDIPEGIQRNSLPGIMKILIPADKNDFQMRLLLQRPAGQLHAGHNGHFDIRHHNIRGLLLQQLQSLIAACCGGAHLHVQTAPVHKPGKPLQIQQLIVYQEHLVHHRTLRMFRDGKFHAKWTKGVYIFIQYTPPCPRRSIIFSSWRDCFASVRSEI